MSTTWCGCGAWAACVPAAAPWRTAPRCLWKSGSPWRAFWRAQAAADSALRSVAHARLPHTRGCGERGARGARRVGAKSLNAPRGVLHAHWAPARGPALVCALTVAHTRRNGDFWRLVRRPRTQCVDASGSRALTPARALPGATSRHPLEGRDFVECWPARCAARRRCCVLRAGALRCGVKKDGSTGDRTLDFCRVKTALYQLSYQPLCSGAVLVICSLRPRPVCLARFAPYHNPPCSDTTAADGTRCLTHHPRPAIRARDLTNRPDPAQRWQLASFVARCWRPRRADSSNLPGRRRPRRAR
jgi:hypothetical protein